MSFKRIKFIDPVESLSGKRNKNSKTCFFQGQTYGQRGWGLGERNLDTHPLSNDEINRRATFKAIALKVAARRKTSSPTYEQDLAAFFAQRDMPGGYPTIQKWLWADEMSKA